MNHCPLCTHPIYLDVDEPHILRCILRFGVFVRFGSGSWWWWCNPSARVS